MDKQIEFRFIESLEPWAKVHAEKKDNVSVAEMMDMGPARSLVPRTHTFKEEEKPTVRKSLTAATIFGVKGKAHGQKVADRGYQPCTDKTLY